MDVIELNVRSTYWSSVVGLKLTNNGKKKILVEFQFFYWKLVDQKLTKMKKFR